MIKKRNNDLTFNSFFFEVTKNLPRFATFEKITCEFLEHKDFAMWIFFRIAIPIIIFNIIINFFIFNKFGLSPTIFGIAIFFYATFLVDLDSFFTPDKKSKDATLTQRILILLLAPIVIYYLLSKKIRPIHIPHKYFHQKKSMAIFCLFVFVIGFLLFSNIVDAFFLMLLALVGYMTHLIVDKVIKLK